MTKSNDVKIRGCVVCDAEDEKRIALRNYEGKPAKKFYSEDVRDAALSRIYSGEAYREHEERKEEYLEAIESGIDPVSLMEEERRKNLNSYYDEDREYEQYEEDPDW